MNDQPHAQDLGVNWDPDGRLEVLTFDLQGETFALEAGMVQEILDLLPETSVPGSGPLVGGVINFRGKVIPLADLRVAFGMERGRPTPDTRIVVIAHELEGETTLVGLKADKVHEVTTLTRQASEAAPRLGLRWRPDYVRSLVRRADDLLILPNLDQIFTADDPSGAFAASGHPSQS